MWLIDFILNLAGLLLWLNWRAAMADPLGKSKPATLIGTLRRVEPGSAWTRWQLPALLGGLLLLRALFYWQIGSAAGWIGRLDLGATVIFFRSNLLGQMLLFSLVSFTRMFTILYLWLVLLSVLGGPMPTHQLVKMQLGRLDGWPRWVKCLLPLVVIAAAWGLACWPLAWLHIIPRPASAAQVLGASLVIALGSYLVWQYLIAALLALHLLNSYIYFGKHPFWNYVDATARTLLQPLIVLLRFLWSIVRTCLPRSWPLREGKTNFSPALKNAGAALLKVAGIALVFLLAELAGHFLMFLYRQWSL